MEKAVAGMSQVIAKYVVMHHYLTQLKANANSNLKLAIKKPSLYKYRAGL
ncbi:MAG: hypothetical protein RBR82_04880 [Pseudomonas sp.]|nr:hypothetical protein [Pseudomonas sp.]